jgi:hypothetical protein
MYITFLGAATVAAIGPRAKISAIMFASPATLPVRGGVTKPLR